MHSIKTLAVGLLGCSAMAFSTAAHADPVAQNAETVRKLNIMLMVTSLRCRTGEHDFQPEYRRFAIAHQVSLEDAHKHLKRQMSASHSERQRKRALDRIGVSIANTYGNGHPWLDCAGLKTATIELSMSQDRKRLVDMADVLMSKTEPTLAVAAKPTSPVDGVKAEPPYTDDEPSVLVAWWRKG